MSLLGNLADLGLGDIFQIVSLSRRSGMLQLTTASDSGEIVFTDGRIVAVYTTGAEQTVGEGLLELELMPPTTYQDMLAAQAEEISVPEIFERFGIAEDDGANALDELLKKRIYTMFDWDEGTFSFVLEDITDPWRGCTLTGTRIVSVRGLNPQYVAIEGARLRDERQREDTLVSFLARDKAKQPGLSSSHTAEAMSFAETLTQSDASDPTDDSAPTPAPTPAPSPAVHDLAPVKSPEPQASSADVTAPQPAADQSEKVIPFPQDRARKMAAARTSARVDGAAALATAESVAPANEEVGVEPSPEAQPATQSTASGYRLLVVDDDPEVTRYLLEAFQRRFASVVVANSVADALPEIESGPAGLVVATDLIVARSDGAGILGGIEVIEKVRDRSPSVPVILFSDYENSEAQERANSLGISAFLMKPRKAQIHAPKGGSGLSLPMQAFIDAMSEALAPYLGEAVVVPADASPLPQAKGVGDVAGAGVTAEAEMQPAAESEAATPTETKPAAPAADKDAPDRAVVEAAPSTPPRHAVGGAFDLREEIADDISIDEIEVPGAEDLPPSVDSHGPVGTLRSMLAELVDPANRDAITLMALRFASEVFERAALFLVTRRAYVGLGGFDNNEASDEFVGRVRRLQIPVEAESVFATVVRYRATYRGPMPDNDGDRQLLDGLGSDELKGDVAAMPLISGGRVAAILYGDNPSGAVLPPTDTLEIFLQQAGLAMDRSLLERKLDEKRPDRDVSN